MVYKVGAINRLDSSGAQYYLDIAKVASGGYVYLYRDAVYDANDTYDFYLDKFDQTGTRIGSAVETAPQNGHNWDAGFTFASDGSYIVTWEMGDIPLSGEARYDIYFQRYSSTGEAVGSTTRVNSSTAASQRTPETAYLANGGFAVVWDGNNGQYDAIRLARYGASGNKLTETVVNSNTNGIQWDPEIAVLSGGKFVVTWRASQSIASEDYDFYMKLYKTDGTVVVTDTRVNNTTAGSVITGVVETLTDRSKFVAGWVTEGLADGSYSVNFEVNNNAGDTLSTASIKVGTGTLVKQQAMSITALSDGGFLAFWVEQDDSLDTLKAQRFSVDAKKLGDVFTIYKAEATSENSNTDTIDAPITEELSNGNIVVAWDNSPYQNHQTILTYENTKPTVLGETGTMREDQRSAFTVLSNDKDIDGDTLTIKSVDVTKGKANVEIGADGTLSVTYAGRNMLPTETAQVTVKYTVTDGKLETKGTLDLTVQGVIEDINGTNASEKLNGTDLGETIHGWDGLDTIMGNGGDDFIYGDALDDKLFGNDGKDRISGGSGSDTMTGGADSDRFLFVKGDFGSNPAVDIIKDFDTKGADHDTLAFVGYGSSIDSRTDLQIKYSKTYDGLSIMSNADKGVIVLEGITKPGELTNDLLSF
ncbi:MAG: hypothetical protein RLZZ444_742 [Pseudomonadota bacterium]|jgi:hypothetical protein